MNAAGLPPRALFDQVERFVGTRIDDLTRTQLADFMCEREWTYTYSDKLTSNKFADLWEHNPEYSKHKVTIEDAVREGLKIDLAELKNGVDDPDIWAQEYMCEFIDATGIGAMLAEEAAKKLGSKCQGVVFNVALRAARQPSLEFDKGD